MKKTKIICDRCGQEVQQRSPEMQALENDIKIQRIYMNIYKVEVDLCYRCQKKVMEFIFNNEKEENGNENTS